jgi:hypothetical protein
MLSQKIHLRIDILFKILFVHKKLTAAGRFQISEITRKFNKL